MTVLFTRGVRILAATNLPTTIRIAPPKTTFAPYGLSKKAGARMSGAPLVRVGALMKNKTTKVTEFHGYLRTK
jgi:hypothetical protein